VAGIDRSRESAPDRNAPTGGIKAIIGTAGHIDHGKSALVRTLTGIDTDRLPEERERGISIELGFAWLDVDGIGRIGVVDVPGHERFIRQMVAGAHGFDLVLVVVAADDGVMPQTEEHFDIVDLLAVERAIFVISKTDAVAAARVEEVRDEIEILAAGTRFEAAPVVAVSARSGEGVEELRACIAGQLRTLTAKSTSGLLRVPIDRVFVMKGHGVVATGTAVAGRVSVGDEVLILPSARRARVRDVQVHGAAVEWATAGQRVALNLSGIARDDVARGDTVTSTQAPAPTMRLDARVEVRPAAGRALPSQLRVRVYHAAREVSGRLSWLDGVTEVAPRGSGYAQLTLAEPLVVVAGDRFVLRDETATRTLGGGVALVAHAARHRRSQGEVSRWLAALESSDAATRLHAVLASAAAPATESADAAAAARIEAPLAAGLLDDRRIAALPDRAQPQLLLTAERLEAASSAVVAAVGEYQAANANLAGVDLELLRSRVHPILDAKLLRLLIDRLVAGGTLVRRGSVVHTRDHTASLGSRDDALATRMLARIAAAGVMPPTIKEIASELGIDPALATRLAGVLVLREELVRVAADLYFARATIDEIRSRLGEHLRHHREISAAEFRDLIAASRKYCIPLLDWFDRDGMTIRVGDLRRLRGH